MPRSGGPSLPLRFLAAAGVWLAVYLVFGEASQSLGGNADPTILRLMAAGLGFFAGLVLMAGVWPEPFHCTYVGEEGAAYFIGWAGQSVPIERQVVSFREMTALFTSTTDVYKNFFYDYTAFRYEWHNDVREPASLKIIQTHTYQDGCPPAEHLFHFAQRVEDLWLNELIARMGVELPAGRSLAFPCRKATLSERLAAGGRHNRMQEVRLNRNELQFVYDDGVETMAISELRNVNANRGMLKLEQHDAAWFGNRGKFRIDYKRLGNAKAFLYYLSLVMPDQATVG